MENDTENGVNWKNRVRVKVSKHFCHRCSVDYFSVQQLNSHTCTDDLVVKDVSNQNGKERTQPLKTIQVNSLKSKCGGTSRAPPQCLVENDDIEINCKRCGKDFSSLQSLINHLHFKVIPVTCNNNSTTSKNDPLSLSQNNNDNNNNNLSCAENNQYEEVKIEDETSGEEESYDSDENNVQSIIKETAVIDKDETSTIYFRPQYAPQYRSANFNKGRERIVKKKFIDQKNHNKNMNSTNSYEIQNNNNNNNENENSFKCPDCGLNLNTEQAIKSHQLQQKIMPTECVGSSCSLKFDSRCALRKHIFSCPCLVVKSKRKFRSSRQKPPPRAPAEERREKMRAAATARKEKVEARDRLICPHENCKMKLASNEGLKIHLRRHRKEKNHMCEQCGMVFFNDSSLRRHISTRHGQEGGQEDKKYQCDICQAFFKGQATLRAHKEIHTSNKKFLCAVCGRAFRTRDNHNVHLRTHAKEKFLKCPICPDKGFNHNTGLKEHMKKLHPNFQSLYI